MRILFTVHTYWPERNGVQYVTQYLAEGLVMLGHEVTVITTTDKLDKVSEEYHNGVLIKRLFLSCHFSVFVRGKHKYRKNVMELISNCDCLINCCVQSPCNNVLLDQLKKVKCKKILYLHGMHNFKKAPNSDLKYSLWHLVMNIRWWLFYKINEKNFRLYDDIIDIHESSIAIPFFKKMGINCPISIINNAVEDFDCVKISETDFLRFPVLNEKYFLTVANFIELKNQELSIRAFQKVRNRNGYKLVLIGKSSDYSEYLKSICDDNDIYIYEDLDRNITKKFIVNASCGLISSRAEIYPIFIAENLINHHLYISTDVGCVRSIPGGIIVKNENEMVDAMNKVISHANIDALVEAGYLYAKENFVQSDKVKQLEAIIKK